MRAWQKCKGAAQRNSVIPLHFLGGIAGSGARIPWLAFLLFCCKDPERVSTGAILHSVYYRPTSISKNVTHCVLNYLPYFSMISNLADAVCQISTQCVKNLPQGCDPFTYNVLRL